MFTCTTILSLLAIIADAYETWHLVDLAQVVCPKPSYPGAPEFPDYNLGINYTSELQVDAPHIIGFIRASKQAMSITFKVEDYYGEQVDTWCCANWCYVDKECPSAIASLNPGMEGLLFWSDHVCVDDPALMLQCPYKPQPNISDTDTSCNCLDATMPSELLESLGLNLSIYADYGRQCGPHDAEVCDKTYPDPGTDYAMWCCTSWCWVSANCPRARASAVWQGHYWSDEKCPLNEEAVSRCKWDSACECRGQLPTGTFDGKGNFSADYGSSDDAALTYNLATDTCDATTRRLSSRRRGGSWGSSSYSSSSWSSYSSPRRRAPSAMATYPRRRSYSAPSPPSPRRRSPPSPPPPDVRRRAPPPPVPSPIESRRRTTSLNGQSYATSPRRRFPGDADLRRRRTIPEQPYGYANRPAMMNNYGGTMPQQTPYGYSGGPTGRAVGGWETHGVAGYNAVPAQKPVNVAMYAAGGAVAGAVVGAGAMNLGMD
eukprot:Skav217326  [mRNA]  locus=scaffold2460:34852:43974:- [translate_table: standard]